MFVSEIPEIVIKEEPSEVNHVKESDEQLTNHVMESKNGHISPKPEPSESPTSNSVMPETIDPKKELRVFNHNVKLRQLVVKEVRKPGKRKLKVLSNFLIR